MWPILIAAVHNCIAIIATRDNEFPQIQDLFNFGAVKLNNATLAPYFESKELVFDVNNLNIQKFGSKLDLMAHYVFDDHTSREMIKFNDTRRQNLREIMKINDTRRQKLEYVTSWRWNVASLHLLKVKVLDLCLQTIYMARHKLEKLEKDPHFNRRDTGYRIAFIYKRLRRLNRKIQDIYMTIKKSFHTNKWKWTGTDHMLSLHERTIRFHVDFLYLWWVMIGIDGTYRDSFNLPRSSTPDLNDIRITKDPHEGGYGGDELWKVFKEAIE